MQKMLRSLDRLFLIFLIVNPLLDLAGGVQIYLLNGGQGMLGSHQLLVNPTLGLSLAVRMVLFVVMAVYLLALRDWRAVLTGAGIAAAFVLSVAGEVLRGEPFVFREDLMYIARFGFNVAALLVYTHVLARSRADAQTVRRRVDDLLCWTLIVAALGILLPYLAGIGFYTYADPMGYRGCRGLFYSGNDAAALMMLLLPLTLCALLRLERLKSARGAAYLFGPACGVTALLVLGTKTAFLAIAATVGGVAAYAVVHALRRRDMALLGRFCAFVLAFAVFFGVVSLLSGNKIAGSIYTSFTFTGEYVESAGVETAMLSGRSTKLIAAWRDFSAALPWSALIGVGRGSQQMVIEMDVLELFLYYGVLGAAALAWVYLKNGVQFVIDLFRRFSLTAWCSMLSLVLCCGYLFLAGHTLFSVTSGFYFALTILYARVFCSAEGTSVRLI